MSASRVTIVITTCGDRAAFLREAIASVRDQGADVLVVVDGPRELRVADLESSLVYRVRFNAGPKGRAHAANLGVEGARSPLVGFLDDDDVLLPGHVTKLADALDSHPEDGAAYSDVEVVRCTSTNAPQFVSHVYDRPFTRAELLRENRRPNMAFLYRRRLLAKNHLDARWWPFDDWDLLCRLSCKTTFRHVPGVSAQYRIRTNGTNAILGDHSKQLAALKQRNTSLLG